jgi:hypothetical protein
LAGDSLSNLAGTYAIFLALVAFLVPGALMLARSPVRWLAQLPVLLVVGLMGVSTITRLVRLPYPRPAGKYEVGSYQEITERIRTGLGGTKTRCELRAPTSEQQAEWRRLQEPRKHGKTALSDLLRQPDGELVVEISSRLLDEAYSTGVGGMTEQERNLYLVDSLQGEVFNGGFHQYFSNSSGNCTALTRVAAAAIDSELSSIFEQAVARFPNSSPAEDRATRNSQWRHSTTSMKVGPSSMTPSTSSPSTKPWCATFG